MYGHRVVVTGLGVITPAGMSVDDAWSAYADGRVVVDTVAEQAGNQIIRNAEAELEL